MDKRLHFVLLLLGCTMGIFLGGCVPHIPFTLPKNSLNIYNTYWDNFSGNIEIGKVYVYQNKGFDRKLHFHVLQVLSDEAALIIRQSATDWINNKLETICEEAIFLVVSKNTYADGVKLRNGNYICTGTYQYDTKGGDTRTVYILKELPQTTAPANAE